jgi:hypothetical protein
MENSREKFYTEEKEKIVDIGGGGGEYFSRLAREHPGKTFLVLDPQRNSIQENPPNLFFTQWKSDVDSKIPFRADSVDEAHINFLMGEIRSKEPETGTEEEAVRRYRRLLSQLKEVLKQKGLVHIVDVQDNIKFVKRALEQEGYLIIEGPTPLQDEKITKWSEFFYSVSKKSGRKLEESMALPVVIRARLEDKRF